MAVRMMAAAMLGLLGITGVAQAQTYGLHQKSLERINAAHSIACTATTRTRSCAAASSPKPVPR